MYQTNALDGAILLFTLVISVILILGIILSIVAFRTKSVIAEVIAWMCGIIWFLFYLFLKNANFQDIGFLVDFSRYLIFMIFFILLQHRTNSSSGILLKIFYIAKSVLLVICVTELSRQLTILLVTGDPPRTKTLMVFSDILGNLVFWATNTIIAIRYLKKIQQPFLRSDSFKNALLFTVSIFVLVTPINMLLFVLETFVSDPNFSSIFIFDGLFLTVQLASLVIGGGLSALIASSIYIWNSKDLETGTI